MFSGDKVTGFFYKVDTFCNFFILIRKDDKQYQKHYEELTNEYFGEDIHKQHLRNKQCRTKCATLLYERKFCYTDRTIKLRVNKI